MGAYGALCSPIWIACEELFLSFCTANLFISNFINFDFVIKIFYSTYMFIGQKRLFGTNILLYVNLYRAKKSSGKTFYSIWICIEQKNLLQWKIFMQIFFCFWFNRIANNFIFTAVAQGFQNCAWIWNWTMGSGLKNWTDKQTNTQTDLRGFKYRLTPDLAFECWASNPIM